VRHNERVFERFTDEARRVVVMAQEEAREMPHDYIGTEHLLLGLLRVDESVGFWALNDAGVSLDSARRAVRRIVGAGEKPAGHIPFTVRAKKALENAYRQSIKRGDQAVGSGHLLLGLLDEPHGVAVEVINDHGVALDPLRQQLVGAMGVREEARSLDAPIAEVVTLPGPDAALAERLDAIEAKLDEVLRQLRRSS
jgi:ATP-dependent Clp protease ATP-binding subunit ClpC